MSDPTPPKCDVCGRQKKWLFRLECFCPMNCDRYPAAPKQPDKILCPKCGSDDIEPFTGQWHWPLWHCIPCGDVWAKKP